jgi:hypothetical protein
MLSWVVKADAGCNSTGRVGVRRIKRGGRNLCRKLLLRCQVVVGSGNCKDHFNQDGFQCACGVQT